MRGDEPLYRLHRHPAGVEFPTCVGMNLSLPARGRWAFGVPHMRGDEPSTTLKTIDSKESSPHAWG